MKTNQIQNKQKQSKKKQKEGGKQGRERAGRDELDAWGRVRS
jgi:hypothetical protein